MEEWFPLQEFFGYSASDLGKIRNNKRGNILTPSRLGFGYLYVALMQNGRQVRRGLSKLIAETFVPKPIAYVPFDTVIHLDGERENCQASNLMWRPRWFAISYMQQFQKTMPYGHPVRNLVTGEIFQDIREVVMTDGLLYNQVLKSIVEGTQVFPTQDVFKWA